MPLELADREDLQSYISEFPEAKLFYRRIDGHFDVVAGKVAWQGEPKDPDDFETWLVEREAMKVKRFAELEQLFG